MALSRAEIDSDVFAIEGAARGGTASGSGDGSTSGRRGGSRSGGGGSSSGNGGGGSSSGNGGGGSGGSTPPQARHSAAGRKRDADGIVDSPDSPAKRVRRIPSGGGGIGGRGSGGGDIGGGGGSGGGGPSASPRGNASKKRSRGTSNDDDGDGRGTPEAKRARGDAARIAVVERSVSPACISQPKDGGLLGFVGNNTSSDTIGADSEAPAKAVGSPLHPALSSPPSTIRGCSSCSAAPTPLPPSD